MELLEKGSFILLYFQFKAYIIPGIFTEVLNSKLFVVGRYTPCMIKNQHRINPNNLEVMRFQ